MTGSDIVAMIGAAAWTSGAIEEAKSTAQVRSRRTWSLYRKSTCGLNFWRDLDAGFDGL